MNVLSKKVRSLKEGNDHKSAVTQKLAAEEVGRIAGQIKMLADLLARISIEHVNRKPRV